MKMYKDRDCTIPALCPLRAMAQCVSECAMCFNVSKENLRFCTVSNGSDNLFANDESTVLHETDLDHCASCGEPISFGDTIFMDWDNHLIYCHACGVRREVERRHEDKAHAEVDGRE